MRSARYCLARSYNLSILGSVILSHPVEESLGVHYAGPYYVFTAGVHIRYDIRVLAAEAATKKPDATSTKRTYPKIQSQIRQSELAYFVCFLKR